MIIAVLIFLVLVLLGCVYILIRNEMVYRFNKKQIELGNYKIVHRYDEMVLSFKPLKSFL